jgi:hypothetical protein
MTGRDRMVLIVVVVLVALGGAWILVVSPERQQASKASAQVAEVKTQLATAETQLAGAKAAQAQYTKAYASVVSLGKAVPPNQEVPSLIYELSQVTHQKNVEFASIVSSSAGSGAAAGPAASGPASTAALSAGFSAMPFTFVFNGSFFDLEHLFQQLSRFTLRGVSGGLQVNGRLLTIQSIKLASATSGSEQAGRSGRSPQLTSTIGATAYVLPAAQGLTAGATPVSPTGTATPVTSTSGAPSSPTAPAVARVTP